MKKILITTCILGMALTSSYLLAAGEGKMDTHPGMEAGAHGDSYQKTQFESLDKNKDGMIDAQEAKADKALSNQFKTIAKKGKIDKASYMNWHMSQQQGE